MFDRSYSYVDEFIQYTKMQEVAPDCRGRDTLAEIDRVGMRIEELSSIPAFQTPPCSDSGADVRQ